MAAASADDIDYDMMTQIFIRLDVKDLMKCKAVCKSWNSLIFTPCFSQSYLTIKHNDNNPPRQRTNRIFRKGLSYTHLVENNLFLVGSANGLVCVSPEGFQLLVVNPFTRQTLKILEPPPEPLPDSDRRWNLVWGFGYDLSNDDYKIVVGFLDTMSTRFYVFSLKMCRWKFVGTCDFPSISDSVSGVLCDGALYWQTTDWKTRELAVVSFNLSREEFTKTQLPDGSQHESGTYYQLGVMEESLYLYATRQGDIVLARPSKIWVLRKQYFWESLPPNCYVTNYDHATYFMKDDYSVRDKPHVSSNSAIFIEAPIYVRSLVSPYSCSKSSSNVM